jgi:alkane 1-monooxygenase
MRLRAFKYASPFIVFVLAWSSFYGHGIYTFIPVFWSYIFVPVLELLLKPNQQNLEYAEEELAKADRTYDYILYAVPPLLYLSLFMFLSSLQQPGLTTLEYVGRTMTMGLLCGIFGINVAHELGHRTNKTEQFLAKSLLLVSQYMHFFIEHNRGHHKYVATQRDPSSARLNEWLFAFYGRTIFYSYKSAWHIANKEVEKKGKPALSWHNEMVQFTTIQMVFIAVIFLFFGLKITACYLVAAALGIALLETVNYIEHYGLRRKEIAPGKYERAMPEHSWNSNHVIGRLMLFELSRHSDHHYLASRKYQVLRHHDNSPQMPTGYPGMMILAHIPPLFIYVMRKQMKKYFLHQKKTNDF